MAQKQWRLEIKNGISTPWRSAFCEEFQIFEDHSDNEVPYWYAVSPYANQHDTIDEAAKVFLSISFILNGVLKISSQGNSNAPFVFGKVYCEDPYIQGRSVSLQDDIIENPFSSIARKSNSTPNTLVSILMNEAVTNEDLRMLCLATGLISTTTNIERMLCWRTLYNLLDDMKAINKNQKLNFQFDDKQLNLFTYTCNNRAVLGIAATHGQNLKFKVSPTLKPLTLDESIDLILKQLHAFCVAWLGITFL